ncbi:hypothetical protein GGI43DRAFT_239855 [Trichoderma evansii]
MLDCRATRFFDTCWHGVAHSSIVIKLLPPHKRRYAVDESPRGAPFYHLEARMHSLSVFLVRSVITSTTQRGQRKHLRTFQRASSSSGAKSSALKRNHQGSSVPLLCCLGFFVWMTCIAYVLMRRYELVLTASMCGVRVPVCIYYLGPMCQHRVVVIFDDPVAR